MNTIRTHLRILMAAGSLAGFLGGWVLLAHAPKPVAPARAATVELTPPPDLPALPGLQPLPALPQSPGFAMPLLRTRGS